MMEREVPNGDVIKEVEREVEDILSDLEFNLIDREEAIRRLEELYEKYKDNPRVQEIIEEAMMDIEEEYGEE